MVRVLWLLWTIPCTWWIIFLKDQQIFLTFIRLPFKNFSVTKNIDVHYFICWKVKVIWIRQMKYQTPLLSIETSTRHQQWFFDWCQLFRVHVANYSGGYINTWPMHYQLTAGHVRLSVWPCISHTLCIWIIHDPPPLCHRSTSISEYPVLLSPGKRGKYNMPDEDSMCYWKVNALVISQL